MEKATAHIVVSGLVQGVNYRYFTMGHANSFNLKGYVRNAADGTVELEVEGNRDELERFVSMLREGPRAARVSDVRVEWSEYKGQFSRFEVTF